MITSQSGGFDGSPQATRRAEALLAALVHDPNSPTQGELLHLGQHIYKLTEQLHRVQNQLARSRCRNAHLCDLAPVGYMCLGADGTIREINITAADMLAEERVSLVGRFLSDFVADEHKAVLEGHLRNCLGASEVQICEVTLEAGDGRDVPVVLRSVSERGEGRTGLVCRTVLIDVARRKQAEQALLQSRRMLHTVLNSIPVRVFWKDRDLKYLGCNQAFAAGAGLQSPEQIVGMVDTQMPWAEQAARYNADDREVMRTGRAKTVFEEPQTTPTGEQIRLLTTKSPMRDPDGRIVGLVGTYEQITERKRAQETLRDPDKGYLEGALVDMTDRKRAEEERRKLEVQVQHAQKLESLGVLAGGIAHDFNNLLVAILGNADLALMDMPPGAAERQSIEEIKKAAKRASELTNQMLAYSGKGQFVIAVVDVNDLVREMGHLLEVSISKKAILTYDLADSLPSIEADASQIRQVVMNLITNASDAVSDASGIISIHTSLIHADSAFLADTYLGKDLPEELYVCLEVSDTGCGMDAEARAKLFDPFFTTKFSGRGLGLAAVLGIIRGHGGAIKVTSAPGEGTVFQILLPVAAADVEHPAVVDRADRIAAVKGATVLVVDDEQSVRNVARLMLTRSGYDVLTAVDGRQAVGMYKRHAEDIDVVLLDMTMPHMGGKEAFRQIREIRPDAKIILCSGYSEQDARGRFGATGLAGFLQKPYELDKLTRILNTVIEAPAVKGH